MLRRRYNDTIGAGVNYTSGAAAAALIEPPPAAARLGAKLLAVGPDAAAEECGLVLGDQRVKVVARLDLACGWRKG